MKGLKVKRPFREWIEYGHPWWDFHGRENFCDSELNKAGTMVEVGGKQYLIGDINPSAGTCDDCLEFAEGSIVTRYKVLMDFGE